MICFVIKFQNMFQNILLKENTQKMSGQIFPILGKNMDQSGDGSMIEP